MLGVLLLLLCDNLGLVLEAERERESHEESAGGDYPHDVADHAPSRLEKAGRFGETRRDAVPCGGGHDVDEGGQSLVEGLLGVEVGLVRRQRDRGRRARRRLRHVGRVGRILVLFFDDFDLDHCV